MDTNSKTRYLILAVAIAFLLGFIIQPIVSPLFRQPDKKIIVSKQAPEPIGPYSQAVQSGDFVFISGQIGLDPATGNLSPTVEGQTVQTMENIREILKESGLDFSDVVQTRIYLTDLRDFTAVNGVYQQYFEDHYPARATLQVAGLPRGAVVEIEMVARVR
jgi:2-iminobutanoate/2-iminopropanoate deaminase